MNYSLICIRMNVRFNEINLNESFKQFLADANELGIDAACRIINSFAHRFITASGSEMTDWTQKFSPFFV
jgi:hypothetical protein